MAGQSHELATVLNRLGWGPRELARRINSELSSRGKSSERIDLTAPYSWLRNGYCPYDPIPEVAARVISDESGTEISAEQLWPGHSRSRRVAASHTRQDHSREPASVDATITALAHLSSTGASQPQPQARLAGVDLVNAVITGMTVDISWSARAGRRDRVMPPQAALIGTHVAALRRLDDRQGGGILSLRYITRELSAVVDLVRNANYAPEVGQGLLAAVADLAQLTGWMHFDGQSLTAAQQFLLLAERVARAIDDKGRIVNAVGMLAYVAAHSGQQAEGLQVAYAAADIPTDSAVLRARSAGRVATACAAVGDLRAFRIAADRARELLADGTEDGDRPYLYYLSDEQLTAETGQALLTLASRATASRPALLAEAAAYLTPLSQLDGNTDYQRSALLHGCYLAQTHVALRDLEAAVAATRFALTRIPEVQSARCWRLLGELRTTFRQRKRAAVVADFLPELEDALAG